MKNTNVKTSWMLLGIFTAQMVLPFGGAISSAYGASYDNSYCDAFCGQIVGSGGQVMNLAGTGSWSSTDASTCSAWSSSEYNPSALPSPLPSPWPSTSAQQFQCQWSNNNQATSQCQAYEAGSSGGGFEKIIIPLDIAAAGVCATACFTQVAPGSMEMACDITTGAAGAVDLVSALMMKSSAVGKAVNTIMGGVAAAAGGVLAGERAAGGKVGYGKHDPACYMMAYMVIMATLRGMNFGNDQESKQSACTAIQSLSSGSNTAGNNPSSLYPNGVPTMSGVSGAGTGSSGGSGNSAQVGVSCAQQGLGNQAGGCGLSSEQLSSGDAAALNAGLGQAAAPQAMALAPGLMSALGSGADPGGAVGAALVTRPVAAIWAKLFRISPASSRRTQPNSALSEAPLPKPAVRALQQRPRHLSFDFGGGAGGGLPVPRVIWLLTEPGSQPLRAAQAISFILATSAHCLTSSGVQSLRT